MQVKLEHLSNLELEYRQRGFIMMIKVRLLISTYLLKAYFETLRCTSAKLQLAVFIFANQASILMNNQKLNNQMTKNEDDMQSSCNNSLEVVFEYRFTLEAIYCVCFNIECEKVQSKVPC